MLPADEEGFEGEIYEEDDANFLVEDLNNEGSDEHCSPADDVDRRNDYLILVVVFKVLEVHLLKDVNREIKNYC